MSKQTEALKLALEALEVATTPLAKDRQEVLRAQAAIREALAEQPAPMIRGDIRDGLVDDEPAQRNPYANADNGVYGPEYQNQPAQQEPGRNHWEDGDVFERIGAMKKQPAQQEPVALGYMNAGHVHEMQQGRLPYGYVYPKGGSGADVALYTSPPAQRKPLRDEEIYKAIKDWTGDIDPEDEPSALDIFRAAEAAHGIKENT